VGGGGALAGGCVLKIRNGQNTTVNLWPLKGSSAKVDFQYNTVRISALNEKQTTKKATETIKTAVSKFKVMLFLTLDIKELHNFCSLPRIIRMFKSREIRFGTKT
jgi:hypothetical protein